MAELSTEVYDTIEDADRNQWNNVVKQSSLGNVFHRYEWLQSIERGMDRESMHAVVKKNENPVAILPNTLTEAGSVDYETIVELVPSDRIPDSLPDLGTSVPFVGDNGLPIRGLASTDPGFGGPVILTDELDCLDMLVDAIAERRGRSIRYHTIKAKEMEYMRYGKALAKHGYEPTLLNCRFEIDLDYEFDELLERMAKERRKALRNARSDDHRVYEMDFEDEVRSTYDRYRTDMERVDGEEYPRSFFEELASTMSDRVKLFGVDVEGTHAGRYVHLLDDEQSTVHYYFSAIGDSSNFQYNPTELLHAHAIEWGQENEYRYYDFGATGSSFLDGTFRYKEKYGGRVVPTLRWVNGYAPLFWWVYKIGRKRYQKVAYERE